MKINKDYLNLSENYLFSEIASRVKKYSTEHPDKEIIRLGIGDVTKPLATPIMDALEKAVFEMGKKETFRGYAPDRGYEFLRNAIAEVDYIKRGCDISPDEIFVSDGAKSDCGNIQEIFDKDNVVAVTDPVYPVYADTNVMAGRKIVYMPCTKDNGFVPELPAEKVDILYLCFPNNPTGAVITKENLQKFVDYARKNDSVIIYDAAYEAYITEQDIPHSIYECEGAKEVAIELHSFSKNAGFTGLRLGYAVVPKALVKEGVSLNSLWARRHATKYNGAPYIVQRAGEAVYSMEGMKAVQKQVQEYMENATLIRNALTDMGYEVYGGVNAPYIWLKVPGEMGSWEFFDLLLNKANVVGTPGEGFGKCGEGYFRLTAFGDKNDTIRAMQRLKEL
ncbi:LL-diaminopimelate aminotransferase apoenzyme [Lachnospiraceae bacterium YSD2013]|nr:LL-diaminopimelate aminotransferase apoenzyme [Lachnospiraceae bacterium YSD2013]